jgi:hypothetical protein
MTTAQANEDEIMTDKQFEAIIEMVLQILDRASDLEDAKKALLAIKGEKTRND